MPKQGMEFRLYLRLKRSSVSRLDARMSIIASQDGSSVGSKVNLRDSDLGVVALAFDLGFGV